MAKSQIFEHSDDDLFFILTSDIICDFPLEEMIAFQKLHNNEGTILVFVLKFLISYFQLTKVDEPSKHGVFLSNENGKIVNFVDKPKEFISNKINAGVYLFKTSVFNKISVIPLLSFLIMFFVTKGKIRKYRK